MKNIDEILEGLHLDNHLIVDEIPDLDLYMDQVIQIFENKLEQSKRNEKDKVLTKTMINNYAKGKLFFPIENKKYSKKHLILISMIYQLKGALSINDIKVTLEKLNQKIVDEDFDIEKIYQSYLKLSNNQIERFLVDVEESTEEVANEISLLEDDDFEYLEQFLLIASLINMSNFYRRLAEKLVDNLNQSEE
ncbi:DUF1836 domain-containing protein [Paucisalibacillus globulus]|jgi:DNA-binding transcriptional MerR regulator|uniref:DUF1836 domain-containing protein n=1 Tax=Paucisalibacillus globulus TaxID=351095 RepID=UPI000BB6D827|nr:DUF1836 domain-containing protein [Paucisalibacillus globulus]